MANHLDAKVYGCLKRSNYTSSWLDGGDKSYTKDYITIEDENVSNPINPKDWFRKGWDESLWNPNGAYLPQCQVSHQVVSLKAEYLYLKKIKNLENNKVKL